MCAQGVLVDLYGAVYRLTAERGNGWQSRNQQSQLTSRNTVKSLVKYFSGHVLDYMIC